MFISLKIVEIFGFNDRSELYERYEMVRWSRWCSHGCDTQNRNTVV